MSKRKNPVRWLRNFRFRLLVAEEYQPVSAIPFTKKCAIWIPVVFALGFQIFISTKIPRPSANAISLPDPPGHIAMVALSAGDQVTFAKLATLWLQAFDNQQGQSVPFKQLDYHKVAAWLGAILRLDERAQYPLFNATRIYSFVRQDPDRVRIMVEFIGDEFLKDPANRWEWMAAAIVLAKRDLKDLDLALEYAHALREKTEGVKGVPNWARQMEPFILSDKNKFEESSEMLMQLMNSGEVTDPKEFILLYKRLEDIFAKMLNEGQVNEEQYKKMERTYEELKKRYLELQENRN